MRSVRALLFLCALVCLLVCPSAGRAAEPPAPVYVASSIVNAADGRQTSLAPGTIVSLYGKNLSVATRALQAEDIVNNLLPTGLGGAGVRVGVGGFAAQLFYVSPTQINFLVPADLNPGRWTVQIAVQGLAGPEVAIRLADCSPALFRLDPEYALAARADGSVIDRNNRVRPGEVVIMYASGLGSTTPKLDSGEIAKTAASIDRLQQFKVTLNGLPLERSNLLYAGVAPGFAGLYQINLILPEGFGTDPEIRIGIGDAMSPATLRLAAQ